MEVDKNTVVTAHRMSSLLINICKSSMQQHTATVFQPGVLIHLGAY